MVRINLFQIPKFLENTKMAQFLLENSKNFEVGSEEWINEMKETNNVEYFVETDQIDSVSYFIKLLEVCIHWGQGEKFYTPSLYVYYLLNRDICFKKLIDICLKKRDLSLEILNDMYNEWTESGDINIPDLKHKLITYFSNAGPIENEENVYSFLMMIEYYSDLEPIREIITEFEHFNKMYKNRKEYIRDLPLIPFDNTILNDKYYDRYIFNGLYNPDRQIKIIIKIYINSLKIGYFRIKKFESLLGIITNFKYREDIELHDIFYSPEASEITFNKLDIDNEEFFIDNIIDELIKIRDLFLKMYPSLQTYKNKLDNYKIVDESVVNII